MRDVKPNLTSWLKIWYAGGVKRLLRLVTVMALVVLPSCAYVQSHKNVGELGAYYHGYILDGKEMRVFYDETHRQWYINARDASFKLHYPLVYDSVLRHGEKKPTYRLVRANPSFVYHPVHESTAQVLMRNDGFIQLKVLAEEIARHDIDSWVNSAHFSASYPVLAFIEGDHSYPLPTYRSPIRSSPLVKAVKNLDFVMIDVPATLIYNVAIPFAAPFVFFYEFYRDRP